MTAGLLGILVVNFRDRTSDRFAICHARGTDIGLHVKLTQHAIHDNIEMQFTHPGYDRLAGIFIGANTECGVLLRKLAKSLAHLFLIGSALRFNCNRDDRFRECDVLKHNLFRVAESVAGESILETKGRPNIACAHLGNILTAVGVHPDQTSSPFAFALG